MSKRSFPIIRDVLTGAGLVGVASLGNWEWTSAASLHSDDKVIKKTTGQQVCLPLQRTNMNL